MRGLRIVRGYVQVRIYHNGRPYHKNFGPDCPLARELAQIHLAEKRKEILMGKFGVERPVPRKKFAEVARLYFDIWSQEKTPNGELKHGGAKEAGRVIEKQLIPYFGKQFFNEVKPLDVLRWREKRLLSVSGTSVNREQAVLSSIFSHTEDWVKTERMENFQLPPENPCTSVEKAPNVKRKRVLSILELKALKAACYGIKDFDLWEICAMALKSLLRKKDLFSLESGRIIDTIQAKTRREIVLPIQVDKPLNYANFRKRWEQARRAARLVDCQFRDLRKTGNNLLKMLGHSQKVRQEILGHASQRTTEIYDVPDQEQLKKPLADLDRVIQSI